MKLIAQKATWLSIVSLFIVNMASVVGNILVNNAVSHKKFTIPHLLGPEMWIFIGYTIIGGFVVRKITLYIQKNDIKAVAEGASETTELMSDLSELENSGELVTPIEEDAIDHSVDEVDNVEVNEEETDNDDSTNS